MSHITREQKNIHYKCRMSGIFYINKTMSKFSAHIVGIEVNQSQSPNALTEISNEIKNQNNQQMQAVTQGAAGQQTVGTQNQPNEPLKTVKKKEPHDHIAKFDVWNLATLKKYNEFNLQEEPAFKNTEIALHNFEIQSGESELSYLSIIEQDKISKPFELKTANNHFFKTSFNTQKNPVPKSRMKEKGLRKLSQQALKIVRQLGQATYKQVAVKLVRALEKQELDQSEDERAESNIKRRVYDALNVLIAMDVLQKIGRKIVFPKGEKSQFAHQRYKNQLNDLKEQQLSKRDLIERKKATLKQVTMKINMVDELMQRNKTLKCGPNKIICLPFVCLHLPQSSSKSIQLSESKNQFIVSTSGEYSFFGDIDFLIKGKLNLRK